MVKIIADTTSSIPLQIAEELGIGYLPQIIIFGNESYRDDTEMDTLSFLKKLRSSPVLPKTAAPPPALYTPIYKECSEAGESMVVICPSAEVSGTARSATVAAQDFPDADIRVVDTLSIGSGLASIVLCANEWAKQGLSADEIENRTKEMASRCRLYFYVDTLEFLYKGGRIGGAQALMGSILQVKPILTLKNGRSEPVESQRTKKRALNRIMEMIQEECPRGEEAYMAIMHGDAEEDAIQMKGELMSMLGIKDIPIYLLPPAVLVHAGPGVLAFSFFTKKKE